MNSINEAKPALSFTLNKRRSSLTCIVLLVLISFIVIFIINNKRGTTSNTRTSYIFIQQQQQQQQHNLSTNTSNNHENIPILESFICDNTSSNRFPSSSTTSISNSFNNYRKSTLEPYCNVVPIPRNGWTSAKTYTEKDIAFVIFSASIFYHTRATAIRDTWLSRITNYYILSSTPYPYLPVTVVPNAGEDKLSNMKKLFYGLQIIYQQQMNLSIENRQKWFYIAGCDTFILPHHLLKRLDKYDYTKPIFIGGHSGHHECLGDINPKFTVNFPSGGAGFFFSIKLLELMQPNLTNFVENVWPRTSEISDVALACLVAQLGIRLTNEIGFWAHPPGFTLNENGRENFHKVLEPNDFHYVQPDEMYALDEFYVNQHMDRLISDKNWNEFIKFTRRFVSSHYELLRKKRQECTLPKIENVTEPSTNG